MMRASEGEQYKYMIIKHFLFAIRYVQKQQAWWLLLYAGMTLTQQYISYFIYYSYDSLTTKPVGLKWCDTFN